MKSKQPPTFAEFLAWFSAEVGAGRVTRDQAFEVLKVCAQVEDDGRGRGFYMPFFGVVNG